MDKIFVEVKVVDINLGHGNLGLAVALVFQHIVQLGGLTKFRSLPQMYTPYNKFDALGPFHRTLVLPMASE